jgi:hypothetical protein
MGALLESARDELARCQASAIQDLSMLAVTAGAFVLVVWVAKKALFFFLAVLVLGLDLFKNQRRIVEHPKLQIPARSKDMPLPIGIQGIGAS